MASSYTPRLRLELQAVGENNATWGIRANNDFSLIEDAIAGMATVAMADANVTLTTNNATTDQARCAILKATGALTADRTIFIPAYSKTYLVVNATTGGFSVKVAVTSSLGAVVTVPTGKSAAIWTDGTDVRQPWTASAIADVTGLQTALDAKADASTVTALTTTVAGKQDIATRSQITGNRNEIINGDFEVWNRYSSIPTWIAPISNLYTCDRWVAYSNGTGGTGSITRQDFAAGQTAVPGNPDYFLRWQITSVASGQTLGSCYIEQRMENVRRLSGKRMTVTLYLKGSGTLPVINITQSFGTGGSTTVVTALEANVVLGGSFVKKQYVVDIPSVSGKTIGANSYTGLNIQVPVNATYTLDIAHVSVVRGDASTEDDPYPPTPIFQTQAACARYFQWVSFNVNFYAAAALARLNYAIGLPFEMRVTPSAGTISLDPLMSGNSNSNNGLNIVIPRNPTAVSIVLGANTAGDCYVFGYRAPIDAEI